jgi:hypothetical protein
MTTAGVPPSGVASLTICVSSITLVSAKAQVASPLSSAKKNLLITA